ncbi:hypothetical protein BDV19DRAFT_394943 [Aspergillus venezuelensis]
MRRLEQHLASWVKLNFRDTAEFQPVLDHEGLPQRSEDHLASIQSSIGEEIFYTIFKPPWFGVTSGTTEEVVNELDGGVRETLYASWKAATGTAMEALTAEPRGQLIDNLIANADDRWSNLSSTNAEPRTRTLKNLLGQCATFKDLLSRDPEIFGFFMSAPATVRNRTRQVIKDTAHLFSPRENSTGPEDPTVFARPGFPLPPPKLIEEDYAHNQFHLLVACIFLNRTPEDRARPIIQRSLARYPTPDLLATADLEDIASYFKTLGLSRRAWWLITLAQTWCTNPPRPYALYRK